MKLLSVILLLIPAPFLFHFYEYNLNGEGSLLVVFSLLYIVITGILFSRHKFFNFISINCITLFLSLLLTWIFIPDDSTWFKPVNKEIAVVFVWVLFLIGQIFIRFIAKKLFDFNKYGK
ncbi:hypothetical protein LGQ02_06685 [Bacillus shivajii]|uniref:hypothetical protein n=1 Tax=Bacillus shivajii TaxID=1983719 RepID=UPI001CFA4ED7|nr:hypothetical protein [Bacillus shivajii]UCZ54445.1 hypothetical protein LGQ02_06685 [Bacillus shivajii]